MAFETFGDIPTDRGFAETIRSTLKYLQEKLGFTMWMMTRKEGDDWIIMLTEDQGYGVEEGSVLRWSDSFCSRMVDGLGPRVAPSSNDVSVYVEAPIGKQLPIGAYIGVPVANKDGTLLGSLCAIDPEPQPESIREALPLIELFAKLLASSLAADEYAEEQVRITNKTLLAEKALAKERWRLENILKGTNVGSWEWNVQTGECIFNERWADIIGYTLEELEPVSIETWLQHAHPDDLLQSNDLLERHFSGKAEFYEIECRMKHKEGHWVWVFDRGRVFSWSEDGLPLWMFGTHQDISERKQNEEELRQSKERSQALARTDGLTGVLNRRGWEECLSKEENRAVRNQYPMCVIVLDLNGLKKTNDLYGHQEGDNLIRRAAVCVQNSVRNIDQVARIGGDEFAVLGVECDRAGGEVILGRIQSSFAEQDISASWGLAMRTPERGLFGAMGDADLLMYQMKTEHHREVAKTRK